MSVGDTCGVLLNLLLVLGFITLQLQMHVHSTVWGVLFVR